MRHIPLDYAAELYAKDTSQAREDVLMTLVTHEANPSMAYKYPDGVEISIMDWIVKRGHSERIYKFCTAHR